MPKKNISDSLDEFRRIMQMKTPEEMEELRRRGDELMYKLRPWMREWDECHSDKHRDTYNGQSKNYGEEITNMLNHQNKQECLNGVPHILSYENTDRLKHEVAFHNPNHLNPNEMLNEILERYFNLVDEARK